MNQAYYRQKQNLRAAAPAADPGKIGPRFFDPPPCFFDPPPCLFEALATIVWILYIYMYIYIWALLLYIERGKGRVVTLEEDLVDRAW